MLKVFDGRNNLVETCSTIDGAITVAEKTAAATMLTARVVESGYGPQRVRGFAVPKVLKNKQCAVFCWPGKCKECGGKGQSTVQMSVFGIGQSSQNINITCTTCAGSGEGPSDNSYVR